MKLLLIKGVLFMIVIIGILSITDSIFIVKKYGPVGAVNSFLDTPKNNVDVILLGNSHMLKGVDPIILEAKTGLKTEAIIGGGLEIAQIYFNLEEALKTQSPQLVIVETYPLIMRNSINSEIYHDVVISTIGIDILKWFNSFIYRDFALGQRGNDINAKYNLLAFHDDWKHPEKLMEDITTNKSDLDKFDLQRMQRRSFFLTERGRRNFAMEEFSSDGMTLIEQEKRFIRKFMELSEKENFELLFFTVPVYDEYYKKTRVGFERVSEEIDSMIKESKNAHYYDYNGDLNGLDYEYIMDEEGISKNQHLNYKGIIKTSNSLVDYISKTYNFRSTSSDPRLYSMEKLLYSPEIEYASNLSSEIRNINGVRKGERSTVDTLYFGQKESLIKLKGSVVVKEARQKQKKVHIAFKKNEDFNYITQAENKRMVPLDKSNNEFRFDFSLVMDKRLLEEGVYRLYPILESAEGVYSLVRLEKPAYVEVTNQNREE